MPDSFREHREEWDFLPPGTFPVDTPLVIYVTPHGQSKLRGLPEIFPIIPFGGAFDYFDENVTKVSKKIGFMYY